MHLFRPDAYYVSVLDIDMDALRAQGVRGIVLDVDNTILPRTEREVPENLRAWVRGVADAGFSLCLLSNNWHERVVNAADELGLPFVGRALKPSPHGFIAARKRAGVARRECVVIGDQSFTDVIGAHLAGMRALLVTPLAPQDLRHTRILRKLDRFFLRGLEPLGGPPAFVADEDKPALL